MHLPLLLKQKSLSPRALASGIPPPPALPHAWDWGAAGASAPRWDLISPVTSGGDTCFRASSCHQQGSDAAMRATCSGLVTLKCCLCIYIDIKRLLHLKAQQRAAPRKHAANTHTHTHTRNVFNQRKTQQNWKCWCSAEAAFLPRKWWLKMHIQPRSESKPNKISRILSSDLRGLRIRHFYYKQITKYCQVLWNSFGLINKSMKLLLLMTLSWLSYLL